MLQAELRPLACIAEAQRAGQRDAIHSRVVTRLGSHFGFTPEVSQQIEEAMRAATWSQSWAALEASAMAWCRSVKPHYMHLGPKGPFYPQELLHNATAALLGALHDRLLLADQRWFIEGANALDTLSSQERERIFPNVPPEPELQLAWPLDSQTWLTCTPDLEGKPRPILVRTVEATAPQAGEALLLTRPGEASWSISVVGPAISLEEARPERRWMAASMHHSGMAWSEWTPTLSES